MSASLRRSLVGVSLAFLFVVARPVGAGAHTWDVNEAFSTADGKIWFVEIREANGTPNEIGVGSQTLSSLANVVNICILTSAPTTCNVASPTSGKMILFGNPAYAELAAAQGAPPPDQIVDTDGFFAPAGDTLRYGPYDTWSTGAVPTDGTSSLNRLAGVATNSPTNYAGVTGAVDASSPSPSVVPDGSGAGAPVLVEKLDADGSTLRVTWSVDACVLDGDHQVIYGDLSGLPATPGGVYAPAGSVCGIGSSGTLDWSPPDASDGSGLIWWVVAVNNGAGVEGSWGSYDGAQERGGPGADGSSGQCGVVGKDVRNVCGR